VLLLYSIIEQLVGEQVKKRRSRSRKDFLHKKDSRWKRKVNLTNSTLIYFCY